MLYNERTVKANMKRIELCDLLIACTSAYEASGAEKWQALHDKIEKMVNDFDKEHEADLLKELENI